MRRPEARARGKPVAPARPGARLPRMPPPMQGKLSPIFKLGRRGFPLGQGGSSQVPEDSWGEDERGPIEMKSSGFKGLEMKSRQAQLDRRVPMYSGKGYQRCSAP